MKPQRDGRIASAFSLIEILVAVAVLGLLSLLMLEIVGHAGHSTARAGRQIEGRQYARLALDTLGNDLRTLPHTANVPLMAGRNNTDGNSWLAFLCQARSVGTNSQTSPRLSAVTLSVGPDAANADGGSSLLRGNAPVPWDVPVETALDQAVLGISSPGSPSLSDGVFRLEIVFAMDDGEILPPPVDLSRVQTVIVAVAVTDSKTRDQLIEMGGEQILTQMAASLPPVVAGENLSPVQKWRLDQLDEVPEKLRSNICFAQRTFAIRIAPRAAGE